MIRFTTSLAVLGSLLSFSALGLAQGNGRGHSLEAQERTAYVYKALNAVSQATEDELWQAMNSAKKIKGSCKSKMPSIEMECLLTRQKNFCAELGQESKTKACTYYLDIATINKLSESYFLSNHERYKLLKQDQEKASKEKKQKGLMRFAQPSYQKVLMDRYANLAVNMLLWKGRVCNDRQDTNGNWICMSRKLAEYCQVNMADMGQTWQSCVGSLVWFVGTQGHQIQAPQFRRPILQGSTL